MNRKQKKEIKKAFILVAPVAAMVGVPNGDTYRILRFFSELQIRGVNAGEAAILLRRVLLEIHKNG